MTVRLIPYEALKAKCIPYSKPHLWRLEKASKFPKRVPIGAGRYGYVEEEIDAYIAQKIAERDARSARDLVPCPAQNRGTLMGQKITEQNVEWAKIVTAILPEVNAWLSEKDPDPDNDGVMRAYFVLQAAYDEAHR